MRSTSERRVLPAALQPTWLRASLALPGRACRPPRPHPPGSFSLRALCPHRVPHLRPAPRVPGSKQGPNSPQLPGPSPLAQPSHPAPAHAWPCGGPQPHASPGPARCLLASLTWLQMATASPSDPVSRTQRTPNWLEPQDKGRKSWGKRAGARPPNSSQTDPGAAGESPAFGHLGVVVFFAKWPPLVEVPSLPPWAGLPARPIYRRGSRPPGWC